MSFHQTPEVKFSAKPPRPHAGITLVVALVCLLSLTVAVKATLSDTHTRGNACKYGRHQVLEIQNMMREDRHHIIPKNIKLWIMERTLQADGFLLKNCPKEVLSDPEQGSIHEMLGDYLKSMVQ